MMKPIDLTKIAGGRLISQLTSLFERAFLNMMDPNTDQKKKRVIDLKIVMEKNPDDDSCKISFHSSFKPVPHTPCQTMVAFGRNHSTNEVVMNEYGVGNVKGQMNLEDMCDEDGVINDGFSVKDLRKRNVVNMTKEA